MALNIKNLQAERLARQLARATGESLTEAVIGALRDRLARVQGYGEGLVLVAQVAEIQAFVAALPDRDTRKAEEILGFDDRGLPG
ncbi:MAG: type II toxin-antitoxin system VapB family antitoxin [Gemmatimonadaceae bacterium]